MRIQRLLLVSAISAALGVVSGCANRSVYPQYPQQAYPYGAQPYPGQPYAGQPYAGQPGTVPIQPSPMVGQQPQGTPQAGFSQQPGFGAPPNYAAPTAYYPQPNYAAPPPSSYNAPGNTPFLGR